MKNIYQKHKIFIHISIIIIVAITYIFFILGNRFVFGSNTDWFKQSVSLPEYFRNLFYKTHNLFPNLALHIGAGENIYYFAYYGLFSPLVLCSYLFPFISMIDYIMVAMIINYILSAILFYLFLLKNNYSKEKSLLTSLLFLASYSFLYNNMCQTMFVRYMPFLILALIGVLNFKDKNKSLLLILSIVCIILSSFYFSITCILLIYLYSIYLDIKNNSKFKKLFYNTLKLTIRIFIGILIASFLLLPVVYILKEGRVVLANYPLDILINPSLEYNILFFSYLGLGLNTITIICIIFNILYGKKESKILSIILLILFSYPIFNYLLNGTLYLNSKIFITFIPFILILFIDMLDSIKNIKLLKMLAIIIFIYIYSNIINFNSDGYFNYNYMNIDLILNLLLIYLYFKRKKIVYILPLIGLAFISTYYYFDTDKLFNVENYNYYKNIEKFNINDYNDDKDKIYRYKNEKDINYANKSNADDIFIASSYSSTYNKIYNNVFFSEFSNSKRHKNYFFNESNNNPLFYKFMGIKYLYTINKYVPYGYEKISDIDNYNSALYKSNYTNSIGFASNNLLNSNEYDQLPYIKKLQAYQNNIIIDGKSDNSNLFFYHQKIYLNYEIIKSQNIGIDIKENHYLIDCQNLINDQDEGIIDLKIKNDLKNKTLVIKFVLNNLNMSDEKKEIKINGVKNLVIYNDYLFNYKDKTLKFVISNNEDIDKLKITFSKGYYDISDIEIYTLDNSFFDINNNTNINITNIKGDNISGNINLKYDGYFIFTIPYDKGYTLKVDNKKTDIEIVNKGFIGFKIQKGYHEIDLSFEAPYSKEGKILSLFGIVACIILIKFERKK